MSGFKNCFNIEKRGKFCLMLHSGALKPRMLTAWCGFSPSCMKPLAASLYTGSGENPRYCRISHTYTESHKRNGVFPVQASTEGVKDHFVHEAASHQGKMRRYGCRQSGRSLLQVENRYTESPTIWRSHTGQSDGVQATRKSYFIIVNSIKNK